MRFGIPSAGMAGKQGVAAPVSSRLVCQPCFMCQLLHHCVNASLLLYILLYTACHHVHQLHCCPYNVNLLACCPNTTHSILYDPANYHHVRRFSFMPVHRHHCIHYYLQCPAWPAYYCVSLLALLDLSDTLYTTFFTYSMQLKGMHALFI
jgi:hypothetical protein